MPHQCLFLFMALFATHGLYGFIWNPYASSSFTRFIYNRGTLCSTPYSAIWICAYSSGFPFMIMVTHLGYIFGEKFTIISSRDPSNNIILASSVFVCKYVPTISNVNYCGYKNLLCCECGWGQILFVYCFLPFSTVGAGI